VGTPETAPQLSPKVAQLFWMVHSARATLHSGAAVAGFPTDSINSAARHLGSGDSDKKDTGDLQVQNGHYVVSISNHFRFRRSHQVSECWRKPGADYKLFKNFGDDITDGSEFHATCKQCWPARSRPPPPSAAAAPDEQVATVRRVSAIRASIARESLKVRDGGHDADGRQGKHL
jgi:hypothetical protein